MKPHRFPKLLACLTVLLACHALGGVPEAREEPAYHTRSLLFFPKPFSIFTRPRPEKDGGDTPPYHQKKPEGGGIVSHVLQGGGIGIEIRPLAPLQGILDHAKKFLPGHQRGTVGRPSHERPPPEQPSDNPYERPHHPPQRPGYGRPLRPEYERPHQQQRPNYERPDHDRPNYQRPGHDRPDQHRPNYQRPGHDRPDKEDRPDLEVGPPKDHDIPSHDLKKPPKKEDHVEIGKDPDWEDIGEGGDEEEEEGEYGDGVLQPRRRRPKRFVDSKIYHVPLVYMSNGRTHRVRRIRNGLPAHSPPKNV